MQDVSLQYHAFFMPIVQFFVSVLDGGKKQIDHENFIENLFFPAYSRSYGRLLKDQ